MTSDLRKIFAHNLSVLMERSIDLRSQNALAKRSKVAQTTIGNYLRPETYKGSPNLENIEKLSACFGIDAWRMIHPTMGDKQITEAELALYQKVKALLLEQR